MEKSLSKRDIILNAAVKVFAEKGYYSSRTIEISQEAGVAYGSLYSYFSSKDDILLSIFTERWQALLDRIDLIKQNTSDPEERIHAIIEYIFKSYEHNPDMMKVLITDVPRHKHFYSPNNWKLYNAFLSAVSDMIKDGQEKGIFSEEISPMVVTFSLYGAIDTTIRQYVYNPEYNQEEFPIEQAKQQIIKLLNKGYLKRKE